MLTNWMVLQSPLTTAAEEICTNTASGVVLMVSAVPITPSFPTAFTLCSLVPRGSLAVTSEALQLTSGGVRRSSAAGLWQVATAVMLACSRWSKYLRFTW